MDKETYSPSEFFSGSEFQPFKAEQYKVKEHIKENMENFRVPEIQGSSLNLDNTNPQKDTSNLQDELNKINDLTSQGAGSSVGGSGAISSAGAGAASAGVSVGAATSLVVTAVAGTSIVVGNNILDKPEKPSEEPPIVLPIYGDISYLNSLITYYEDEMSMTYKQDITFYLDGKLNEGYRIEIINPTTNKVGVMNDNNQIILKEVDENKDSFTLNYLNSKDEVVYSEDVIIKNNRINHFDYDNYIPYFITLNSDNTYNLYMEYASSYPGEFYNYLEIFSVDNNSKINADIEINNGYSIARNIPKENIRFNANPYVLIDNNKYSFGDRHESRYVDIKDIRYSAVAKDDVLTFQIDDEFIDPIIIDITYDDNTTSHHEIKKSEMDEVQEILIPLSKISPKLHIDYHIDRVLPNYSGDHIFKQELLDKVSGENHEIVEFCSDIDTRISNKLSFSHAIFPSQSYFGIDQYSSDFVPTMLYFDGYLNPGSGKFGVDVKASNGEILNEHVDELFDDFSKPITFLKTKKNMTYNFTYYLKDEHGKHVINSVNLNPGEKPSNITNADGSIGVYPYGCYMTYNDYNTYNIYNYIDIYNPDEYDLYYLLEFMDVNDLNTPIYSFLGKGPIEINDIPLDKRYTLKAQILQKEGNVYYATSEAYVNSEPIGVFLDGKDAIEIKDCELSYDSQSQEFKLDYNYVLFEEDINISYQIDGGATKNIIIKHSDILQDNVTGSLSVMKFKIPLPEVLPSEILFTASGLYHFNEPLNEETYLALPLNYKGSNTLPFISNLKYPNVSTM